MRKLAIAVALASTALATPAVARDHSLYVGLEGGVMWMEDSTIKINDAQTNPQYSIDHKTGYDVDAIAGYDFGAIRLEAELGYKHAGIDTINTTDTVYPANGNATALSLMANALFDFGDENGLSGYIGGGVGVARVKYSFDAPLVRPYIGAVDLSDNDSRLAWQGIMGVRYAISPNIDIGLKYRLFNASRIRLNGDLPVTATTTIPVVATTRFRSHSLLASVIYNFYAPPPPPPPPPPAPERGF